MALTLLLQADKADLENSSGDFSTSCRDCSWVGSDLSVDLYFNLSCLCFDPQSNIKNSTYNLSTLPLTLSPP